MRPDENGHAELAAGRTVSTRSALFSVLAGIAAASAICLMLLVAWFRDNTPTLTAETLEAARRLWERAGPASYDLELHVEGNRPGRILLEVRSGQPIRFSRDGQTPAQKRTWDYWTVPGQFDMLEREIEIANDPARAFRADPGSQVMLKAQFDTTYGYPVRFVRSVGGGGQDLLWTTLRFLPAREP